MVKMQIKNKKKWMKRNNKRKGKIKTFKILLVDWQALKFQVKINWIIKLMEHLTGKCGNSVDLGTWERVKKIN